MDKAIAVLSGDGIGPEIMREAVKVLEAVSGKYGHAFHFRPAVFGGAAYDACGHPFPEGTKAICDKADAILKGPVGGPKYDSIPDVNLRPERGGLQVLRKRFETYANIRPVRLPASLIHLSPVKTERVASGLDFTIVRELVGGIYFGKKEAGMRNGERYASDLMDYTESQIERVARIAFEEARRRKAKLHNIHKSNVLQCSILWNETVERVRQKEYPDVTVENMLVDNAAYQLVLNPTQFRVMLTENLMGDILSDEAAALMGSLGLMASACIGPSKAYFEPAHGSAPDIAGKNVANPFSMIGSAAMMLAYFGLTAEAEDIWASMFGLMSDGYTTGELHGRKILSTSEFGDAVAARLVGK